MQTIDVSLDELTEDRLIERKGVQIGDILPLLSLSPDAYNEMKKAGGTVILKLSRIQRICKASGLDSEATLTVCKLKTSWDSWYMRHRSFFKDTDLLLLRSECSNCLDSYARNKSKFEDLVKNAEDIVGRYEPKLPIRGLSTELVIGLMFAIGAERGANV